MHATGEQDPAQQDLRTLTGYSPTFLLSTPNLGRAPHRPTDAYRHPENRDFVIRCIFAQVLGTQHWAGLYFTTIKIAKLASEYKILQQQRCTASCHAAGEDCDLP